MKEKQHFTTDSPEQRQGHFICGPTDDQVHTVHEQSIACCTVCAMAGAGHGLYRNSVDTCTVACTIARAVVTGGHVINQKTCVLLISEALPLQAVTL